MVKDHPSRAVRHPFHHFEKELIMRAFLAVLLLVASMAAMTGCKASAETKDHDHGASGEVK